MSVCSLRSLPRTTEHVNIGAFDLLITVLLHNTQTLTAIVHQCIKHTHKMGITMVANGII